METSCCWWRWVGEAGTEVWSGGLDPDLGGAGWQKAETVTPTGNLSCRKACRRAAPPEEIRGHISVRTACWALVTDLFLFENYFRERRRGSSLRGQTSLGKLATLRWAIKYSQTSKHVTRPFQHTQVCDVCTCERILSAGPSFSPMELSRCSSVSSGNVSPSMACSRNTWQRHSRFSHSPDTHTPSTHSHATKLYSKILHPP